MSSMTIAEAAQNALPIAAARAGAGVLIVEDDADTRELLADVLRANGHDVHVASDGERALSMLASGIRVDVMLVDLMMPGINGWDLVPLLRKNPAWADAPVVVMSAAGPQTLASAPQARAYLQKPIDVAALLATVERAASGRRAVV